MLPCVLTLAYTCRWELSQAVLRGLRLAKTVALIIADYKLQDSPFWGDGVPRDQRLSKEAEAALAEAERGAFACRVACVCRGAV